MKDHSHKILKISSNKKGNIINHLIEHFGNQKEFNESRFIETLKFLMCTEGDFSFFINDKPATVGCIQAVKHRCNPWEKEDKKGERIKMGVEMQNEVKSIVMEKNGEIYCFTMTGEDDIDLTIKKRFGLVNANL